MGTPWGVRGSENAKSPSFVSTWDLGVASARASSPPPLPRPPARPAIPSSSPLRQSLTTPRPPANAAAPLRAAGLPLLRFAGATVPPAPTHPPPRSPASGTHRARVQGPRCRALCPAPRAPPGSPPGSRLLALFPKGERLPREAAT